jgi:transcription initiation factor TFIIB
MIVGKSNKQELMSESNGTTSTCMQNNGIHNLVTDSVRGEVLCGRCGVVLADKVEDYGSEQRSFTIENYKNSSRAGLASTLSIHDKGLATVIGTTNKDSSGNSISSYMKYTFNRLRTWDSRSKSSSEERNLRSAFVILGTIQSKLDISDAIIERAAYLYRKALTKNITRGRTISTMISAALYVACRESNVPRTLQDIANAANISFKNLSRHYRVFVNALGLQIESYDPSDFVSKIGTTVGLSEKAKRGALDIIYKSKEKGIASGKSPVSLAATAIFLSGVINKENVTQDKISKAAGISSMTIRNIAKVIKKSLMM